MAEVKNENEMRKAALALNLCTVSVSQIVDYEDINILKQEYDAILNNLNLQEIIKDEALLKSITQIMDVISFYIIQEGDKEMAAKEYQHRLKNAIFDSVSGMGLMVMGNPATMIIGLASQVGIGYLNYRRSKARSQIDFEKQMWQLQRSAIEQLNGLRRSLFETAWRLSDAYNFPDEWRLTEKQIAQYNKILMDADSHRQFDRLSVLDETFKAFPSFWYYKARAAIETASKYESLDKDEMSKSFKVKALESLDKFDEAYFPLMRQDIIAASAALDKFALLDPDKDKEQMKALLERASKMGGSEFDILQMCAVNYIAIKEVEPAVKILRNLVNEQYNTQLNGRLLSRIYQELGKRLEYDFLCDRIGTENVMPWADSMEESMKGIGALNRKRLSESAQNIFQKMIAEQTQKLSFEFFNELNTWERNFSDANISWKEKVQHGATFDSWPSKVRDSLNGSYNNLLGDNGYKLLFGNPINGLKNALHKSAVTSSALIDKLDEALQDFQSKGEKLKADTTMLGVSIYKALRSPKSSLLMEYRSSGNRLSQELKMLFEELFRQFPEFMMNPFLNNIQKIEEEREFEKLEAVLSEKDRKMPLPSITAFAGSEDLETNPNISTDFFGFRLFQQPAAETKTEEATNASSLNAMASVFKKK